jgi:PAS domain S-box-containing protein
MRAADGDLNVSLDPAAVVADLAPLEHAVNRFLVNCRAAAGAGEHHDAARARRRIEEALKESELRFEWMAKQLPHVLFRWGAKGLEYISPSSLQLFGRAPGEILAHSDPRDLMVHPDDRARMDELALNLLGGPIRFTVRVLRPNGDAVWTEQSLSPIFDRNGWIVAVEGVAIDITERMRMESAVRESEELFYTLAKLSPVGIFRADALGRYTYVSDHWRTITGLSLAQALHDRWQTGIHPGDRERVRAAWQQAVQDRKRLRWTRHVTG